MLSSSSSPPRAISFQVVSNGDGALCAHYPLNIIVPTGEAVRAGERATTSDSSTAELDSNGLFGLFADARFARTRSRFVCPVIWHKGKVPIALTLLGVGFCSTLPLASALLAIANKTAS